MSTLAQKIYEKTLTFRYPEIEGLLRLILDNPGISNTELVRYTGFPRESLKEFKAAAAFLLKESQNDSIYIREEYVNQLQGDNPKEYNWTIYSSADKNQIKDIGEKMSELRAKYSSKPQRELDQFFATPQSSIMKAELLAKKGLLTKTNVALLGDDDWLSTAILLYPQNSAKLTILDIDAQLLQTLKEVNGLLGNIDIQYILYDARNSLPKNINQFDAVITDPPYTKSGVILFLNRAIELLDTNRSPTAKYIYLYYGTSNKTPEKTLKIQEIIHQMGLVIEDKLDKVIQYSGAESMGSTSSLYILKTTPFTRPIVQMGNLSSLYTHQNIKEEKFPYVDHVVGKLYDVPLALLKSKSALRQAMGEFCNAHKLKVVDEKLTKFKNDGFTITLILANSNLVAHTWPEFGAVHIDLITCSPIYAVENLPKSLMTYFSAKSVEVRKVE